MVDKNYNSMTLVELDNAFEELEFEYEFNLIGEEEFFNKTDLIMDAIGVLHSEHLMDKLLDESDE